MGKNTDPTMSHNTKHNHTTTNYMARCQATNMSTRSSPPPIAIYRQFRCYAPPFTQGMLVFFFASGGLFGALKGDPLKLKGRDRAQDFDGCHSMGGHNNQPKVGLCSWGDVEEDV